MKSFFLFRTDSLQFSSFKQEPDTDSSNSQFTQFTDNHPNFLNNNSASSFDFNKRKRSLDSNSSFNQDDQKPFDELNSQDSFNQTKFISSTKNFSSKSPSNGSLIEKKLGSNTLEAMLKDTGSSITSAPPKKERKRKKTETDSTKNANLSSIMVSDSNNMQLMPPPSTMVTSSNSQLTSSSPTSNAYGFVDLESSNSSSMNSPALLKAALRPITLNVKPSMNATTSNININTSNFSI